MAEKVQRHDDSPAIINDHAFEPRGQWWSLCKYCGLAQAAHSESTINTQEEIEQEHVASYGEVRYAEPEEVPPPPQVEIAYYSDDNPDDD